jgi:hypothetical protein
VCPGSRCSLLEKSLSRAARAVAKRRLASGDRHTHGAGAARQRSADRPGSDLPSAHVPSSTQGKADRDLRFSSPLRSAIVARRHRRPSPWRAQAGSGRARRLGEAGAAGSAQQPKAASTARCGATPAQLVEQAAVNRRVPGSSPGAGVRSSGMRSLTSRHAVASSGALVWHQRGRESPSPGAGVPLLLRF